MENMDNKQEFNPLEDNPEIENPADEQAENLNENEESANLADDLESKFTELNDSYLRLHAEFDNYRKRTLREKADLLKTGGEKIILGVLPIIDDFERAIPMLPEDAKEGVELIYNKFKTFLSQNGVKEIDAIGETFDTERHEAVTTVPAENNEQKDKVVDCIQKGYMLNDKVIRFAKVIVAK